MAVETRDTSGDGRFLAAAEKTNDSTREKTFGR
jgi:hypothetical protein